MKKVTLIARNDPGASLEFKGASKTEMFVNSDYEPENSEIVVFNLDTRNGQTGCHLYKPKNKSNS